MFTRFAAALIFTTTICACSVPSPERSASLGRKAILYDVDRYLSALDCNNAVRTILPLYNSADSDNEVRMKAASAYGCHAGINFFKMTGDIASHSATIVGPGFWSTMTEFFPSASGSDYKVEGAVSAIDALLATLTPGILVLPPFQVNPGTYNVGSVFPTDRISDANIYLVYAAMAGIGSIESRFGLPDPASFRKRRNLPWATATAGGLASDGCAYAASILNVVDAIGAVSGILPGATGATLANIYASLQVPIDQACSFGCSGTVPPVAAPVNPRNTWAANGCAAATACGGCPTILRDRTRCAQLNTDQVSCAATGLINFINSSDLGWLGDSGDGGWVGP